MPDPVAVFSSQLLSVIKQLAERVRTQIVPPGRPRVLLLPALGACSLGRRGSPHDDVVWIDLHGVRAGRLLDLAYGGPELEALDVFEPVYLQMILRLRLAGYDVGTHPFDWRRPIRSLGRAAPPIASRRKRRRTPLTSRLPTWTCPSPPSRGAAATRSARATSARG